MTMKGLLQRYFHLSPNSKAPAYECIFGFEGSVLFDSLSGRDHLPCGENESEDEWRLRVAFDVKQLVFPDEPITLEVGELDDEGPSFWVSLNFRCPATPEAFVAAIYDLVWEENYFCRAEGVFCARAHANGAQIITLTEEDFNADGQLQIKRNNIYDNETSLRQTFVEAWNSQSQRPWECAWEIVWKQVTAKRSIGDPWLCVRRLAAQVHRNGSE